MVGSVPGLLYATTWADGQGQFLPVEVSRVSRCRDAGGDHGPAADAARDRGSRADRASSGLVSTVATVSRMRRPALCRVPRPDLVGAALLRGEGELPARGDVARGARAGGRPPQRERRPARRAARRCSSRARSTRRSSRAGGGGLEAALARVARGDRRARLRRAGEHARSRRRRVLPLPRGRSGAHPAAADAGVPSTPWTGRRDGSRRDRAARRRGPRARNAARSQPIASSWRGSRSRRAPSSRCSRAISERRSPGRTSTATRPRSPFASSRMPPRRSSSASHWCARSPGGAWRIDAIEQSGVAGDSAFDAFVAYPNEAARRSLEAHLAPEPDAP